MTTHDTGRRLPDWRRSGGLEPVDAWPAAGPINSFGNWQCRILHAATLLHATPPICFAAPWGHGHMEVVPPHILYSFVTR